MGVQTKTTTSIDHLYVTDTQKSRRTTMWGWMAWRWGKILLPEGDFLCLTSPKHPEIDGGGGGKVRPMGKHKQNKWGI